MKKYVSNKKHLKFKGSKLVLLVIIVVVIFAASMILIGSFGNPLTNFILGPLFENENIEEIAIDETIHQGSVEFNIIQLEVGDIYSVLYYDMTPFIMGNSLDGAKLYQNGTILPYVSSATSTSRGCAIAFSPANGMDGLELRIDTIINIEENEYIYPLEFVDNTVEFEMEIDGNIGDITVTLLEDGCLIAADGLAQLEKIEQSGDPSNPVQYILMTDDDDSQIDYHIGNPPTHLKILTRKAIYGDDTIIIPIS